MNMAVVENVLKALWVVLHIIVLFSSKICHTELCAKAFENVGLHIIGKTKK